MFEKIDEEVNAFFVKIIIPTMAAISMMLSVKAKRTGITWFDAITSFIIGIVFASLFGLIIIHYVAPLWVTPVVGALAISSEKISAYYIYKFNVEDFVKDALSGVIQKYFKK